MTNAAENPLLRVDATGMIFAPREQRLMDSEEHTISSDFRSSVLFNIV